MRRTGVTLVEILVAATVGTAIFGGAWAIWRQADRSRGVTAHLRALQTALTIEQVMTEDLASSVLVGASPVGVDEKQPDTLSLYVLAEDHPQVNPVGVRAVFYDREPGTNYLRRQSAGKSEPIGGSPLTSLAFYPFRAPTGPMLRVTMTVGRDPTDPEAARPFVYSFLTRLTVGRPVRGIDTQILHDFAKTEQRPAHPLESP